MDSTKLRGRGIIVACDVRGLGELEDLVGAIADLQYIRGFKVGALLALAHGMSQVLRTVRAASDKFVMYDHQKFGTDIPAMVGGPVLEVLQESGVDGVIIFPQAGPQTLRAAVEGCWKRNLLPIAGGEMTHPGYLVSEGGYIADDAPARMYRDAAGLKVRHFVVPGTKPDQIKMYRDLLAVENEEPVFLFPGIGKGQGGRLSDALDAVGPYDAFAIVGRSIYDSEDPASAAEKLWNG